MAAQDYSWKDLLRDSSWVTIAWDWFMTFLSRAAESVLWVTMVFSCYQLIPGAPQPPASVSNTVFICQFIALDVGGMGLNKLAQRQGLGRWSYVRVIAYILIAVTLITVGYAGLEHVFPPDPTVTQAVEVTLVVIRSVMTVLYGQAIHDLKYKVRSAQDEIVELQTALSDVQFHLSNKQTNGSGQVAPTPGHCPVSIASQANGSGQVDAAGVQWTERTGHLTQTHEARPTGKTAWWASRQRSRNH